MLISPQVSGQLIVLSNAYGSCSSSYWVSWETVIGEVVETVIDGKKDVYEETVDGEKYAYEELRIRLGENVKSLKDPGIQQDREQF